MLRRRPEETFDSGEEREVLDILGIISEYREACPWDIHNLPVVENGQTLPFDVKRVYYLYDVPGGGERGGHSHYTCQEFIIAVSGSFDVTIDDGVEQYTHTLNRPYQGLLVVPGIWRTLKNFSSGSVCLALCSHHFDEDDYVRDYDQFKKMKTSNDE